MSKIDLEPSLKLLGILGSSEAGDRERLRRDREEKDSLSKGAEKWLDGQGNNRNVIAK